jgi:tricorn protease
MRQLAALVLVLLLGLFESSHAEAALLQTPTLSKTDIAFVYAGDIWAVSRQGGEARGLVRGTAAAGHPVFSPDGSMIAYNAKTDGNDDVYIVPATGGESRRLTWHPGDDEVVGWTPDGKNVLFRSRRESTNDSSKLYRISLQGGLPEPLPLPRAEFGSYSADAASIAYEPDFQWEPDWRGYRGGQTARIWVARLADSSVVKIPRENSNDRNPMWIGNLVYFLSDREGPATLYAYDTAAAKVTRVLDNSGFPIDSASAGPGAIVYAQMEKYIFSISPTRAVVQ